MYATGLFLLVQVWAFTGTISFLAYGELAPNILDLKAELDQIRSHGNTIRGNVDDLANIHSSRSPDQRANPQRATTAESYWRQIKDTGKKKWQVRPVRSNSFVHSFASKGDRQSISERAGRFRRETNKFTGLVVGATRDAKLKQSVTQTLNQVETLIWSFQSQYTKPFKTGTGGSSTILGTFNSDFRTNFHGHGLQVQFRRSNDYSTSDLNSLTTLLILQCFIEASIYGSATTPAVSNMSIAVESLKAFYTHTYPRGSSILTMWPEKLLADGKGWVNLPENIRGIPVKETTTYNQLQQLVKSCNCEPAKTGLKEMSENTLCKEHFNKPLADLYGDTATPPDFLTSFSNLALGSLLQAKLPNKNTGIYKAESELWLSDNNELHILTNKLKSMVIYYPAKIVKVTNNGSVNENQTNVNHSSKDTNISSDGKEIRSNIEQQNVESVTVISRNISVDSKVSSSAPVVAGNAGVEDGHNRTARSVSETSPETSLFNSSEHENATEKVARSLLIVNISTTTPAILSATTILPLTPSSATLSATKILPAAPPVIPATSGTTTATTSTSTARHNTAATDIPTTVPTAAKEKVSPVITLDPQRNQIISSESYFAIRPYLDAVIPDGKTEVILIPSLISDDVKIPKNWAVIPDSERSIWHNGQLYHAYNSVNLMTTATTLHALVVSSMAGLIDIGNDVILQRIIVSSLRVLTWYMNNTQELVAMVTLSEFPSMFQLYWATARIAFQLNSNQAQTSKMFQFADEAAAAFVGVLRDKMTFSILQSITDGGLGQDGKTRVYIDDFIGAADVDDKGKKLAGGDDRLFASAMATNALIATWTVQTDSGSLKFVKDTGDPVRIAVNSLANFMHGVVGDHSSNNMNAFMSEQIKNCQTMPARYPANIVTLPNGTVVSPNEPKTEHRFGVKGYIPTQNYQQLLDQPSYGYKTRGGTLEDLNSPTSVFRFWSSPAYTKAAALLAIAQAANLQIEGNS